MPDRPTKFAIHYLAASYRYPCGTHRGDATSDKRGVTCRECRVALKLKPMSHERRARTIAAWNREGA